jgi:hypothetical protein
MFHVARLARYREDMSGTAFASLDEAMTQAQAWRDQGSARVLVLEPIEDGHEIAAIL